MTVDTIITTADAELSARVIIEIDAMLARTRVNGRRMSQAELARRISKTPVWLSDRMTGRVRLTIDDLALIAQGLDCGVVDLLPRDRREPTRSYAPTVSGRVPHPDHPVLAGAVAIRPAGPRRTAPTGL